jgi:ubiquinone/menaquinone biosynthesis C-methylase UbiE
MNTFDERLVLAKNKSIIADEHLIRYELAKKLVAGKTVLDIACGSGYGSKILADASALAVCSVDADISAIEFAKNNYPQANIQYLAGNAEELSFADSYFDVITSLETIEHLNDPEKYLSELARVLKKDGVALISTPNKLVSNCQNPFHLREFEREEFEKMIGKYFPYHTLLEQKNGIATSINVNNKNKGDVFISGSAEPIYFIAICSLENITAEILDKLENIASINLPELVNLRNNPVLKISDKIYSLLVKLHLLKR